MEEWNVTFPKPKPEHARPPPPSGQELTVLHLSDWHVDPLYEVNVELYCLIHEPDVEHNDVYFRLARRQLVISQSAVGLNLPILKTSHSLHQYGV